jgi:probable HAF family extracellular repeat protein
MSFLSGNSLYRAFLWQNGAMTDLGTLNGPHSHAYDISNSGYVVGIASLADGSRHAFRYALSPGGSVVARTDLGTLGGDHSVAYAVSENGSVVGTSDWRAFLWQAGSMTDLNSLIAPDAGWELTHATAINEAGQIAGRGKLHGHDRAFVLTPIVSGDINADGRVDIDDLFMLLNAWGPCNPPPVLCPEDIDRDGDVDVDDLFTLVANWSA